MKKVIKSDKAPAPIGPYSQAILVGNTLYTSGQIALDASSGKLIMDNIAVETEKVMANMNEVLLAAGMGFKDVIKSTIFLSDMGYFDEVNKVYANYFNESSAPARETVQVAGLPKGVNVEISMIAINS